MNPVDYETPCYSLALSRREAVILREALSADLAESARLIVAEQKRYGSAGHIEERAGLAREMGLIGELLERVDALTIER